MSKPAPIGHNNPPIDAFTAIEAEILDLFELAQGALTGEPISSQAQADQIDQLAKDCLKAEQAAESARKDEKKPHDDAAKAVQTKWKPLVDKAVLAKETARRALTPWNIKLDEERKAVAAEIQRLADEAAKKAQDEAISARAGSDLAAAERAEEAIQEAETLQKEASRAAKPVATGLRTYWHAEITDRRLALNHYLKTAPDAFVDLIQTLADQDTRAGVRNIPGVNAIEEKKAA